MSCNGCIHAIYDTYPYGSTTATELTGCKREDDISEEEMDAICDGKIDCPYAEYETEV